jgi:ribonuclease P protein component
MKTFGKQDRLLSRADFDRVFKRKCSISNSWIIVYACANDVGHARLGLSVGKKVGNAVVRNRFKRLFREAFRLSRAELPSNLDLIMIPRSSDEPPLEAVRQSLMTLVPTLARRLSRSEKS